MIKHPGKSNSVLSPKILIRIIFFKLLIINLCTTSN